MRYVSTRGEAPPLGFVEVTLAGLARDGGLYVPEPGRALDRETIAGFAGRPYAEVAVEVIRPFVGDAHCRARSRAHGARGLRQLPPSGGGAARPARRRALSCSSCFTVRRSPSRIWRCSSLARLMDHALHQRGERTTIVVATSGDTGGAAVEAFRGRAQADLFVLFPQRPHLRRAAAHDDHRAGRQRACARDRRHLRRLPGDREGHVQSSRLPRSRAALGRQLDQLGAHRRAGGLLLHRRGRARRAAPQGRLHGADRKFRRRLCRLCRRAHGAADRSPGDRHQRQRHPCAHLRHRHLRAARRGGDLVAVDGHPGVVEFRASAVRCLWPRRGAGARADGLARAVAPVRGVGAGARGHCARCSPPTAPTSRRRAATIRTWLRETGHCVDPHTAVGIGGRREGNARSVGADGRAVDRASRRNFPMRSRRPAACGRRCPTGWPI